MYKHRGDVLDQVEHVIPLEEEIQSVEEAQGRDDHCGKSPQSAGSFLVGQGSKYVFFLAVLGSAILSIVLFIYGFVITLYSVFHAFGNFSPEISAMKEVMATSIEIIDLFLVATVFYIIALGLFELFISKAPLPGWLKICDLDDLKDKLLGLVVIALAVLFLGEALTWTGQADIMAYGIGTAATLIGISLYFWAKH
jgi:uncharacterized membrane protein YqhA